MRILIVGGGEVGFSLARHLAAEKVDVVLIEADRARCARIQEELDIQVLCGQGASPGLLQRAGLDGAAMLLAVTSSDEVNIVACLVARALCPETRRIARVRSQEYLRLLEKAGPECMGLEHAINPEVEAARALWRRLQVPAAEDVRDFFDGLVRLTAFTVEQKAPAAGRKLSDLAQDLEKALVVAVERAGSMTIPRGEDSLQPGDYVWTCCEADRVSRVAALMGKKPTPMHRAALFGGGSVGFHLARLLRKEGIPVKLIEPDRARCEELAGQLPGAVVLHGQAMDLKLLQEEEIGQSSAFVAATEDDEDNLLSSLLALRQGVPKVMALMERTDYQSVLPTLGLSHVVSKNMTAVGMILAHIRRGRILASSLIGSFAEVMEGVALPGSALTQAPLMALRFPRGALIGALVREGRMLIPKGSDRVEPGDRFLVFARNEAVARVEKFLAGGG